MWRCAIVVGLSIAPLGCLGGGCYEERVHGFEIALPTDAMMQFRIDRCQVEPDECLDVCVLAMDREQLGVAPEECKVTVEATRAVVIAHYEIFTGHGRCPLAGDDVAPPPPGPDF
jgi:hypothetical protein